MLVSKLHESLGSDPLILELVGETYGEGATRKILRLRELCLSFIETYGDGPLMVLSAPARINLLGEHVDYVGYIPTASLTFGSREHDMVVLFRPSNDDLVRGLTTLRDYTPFSFRLRDGLGLGDGVDVGQDWEKVLFSRPAPAAHWGNYFRGAVKFACFRHGARICQGFDFLIDSSIPPAGGASSSSALTVLAGAAILRANDIAFDPHQLALDSARAEWYVGTRGGAMDHLTICLSRRSSLLNIHYSNEPPRLVPLPQEKLRFITFFTHKADKSREVMFEYNERAAISRILIPAILDCEHVAATKPEDLDSILSRLPERITFAQVEQMYPEAYQSCQRAFPLLLDARRQSSLKIRDRARHHLGEVMRVSKANQEIERLWRLSMSGSAEADVDSHLRRIGELINLSHDSLRDLYEVSTPDVEDLIRIVRSDPGVFGARLMGGGFGGNVLVMTSEQHAPRLIDSVQSAYYEPRGRHAIREGSIMVSTPGDGLGGLDPESAARGAIESFNATGRFSDERRAKIRGLLDRLETESCEEVWPIIVAAGRGERAKASGIPVTKPLTTIFGVPVIRRVLDAVREGCLCAHPPIVIVSPETEGPLHEALRAENVSFVLQPRSLGTGDAVLCARDRMRDFSGRVLVVWATQPVLRSVTVRRTVKLAALFQEYDMIVPTAMMERPYAPVERDALGRVSSAHETHLERVQASEYGESNIGIFILRSASMFRELEILHRELWREVEMRYARPGGELGFPNELIRRLAGRNGGVLASPIGDWREEKGLKIKSDIELCERYIRELNP